MAVTKRLRRHIPSEDDFNYLDFPFYWLARTYGVYTRRMEEALKKVGTDIPSWRVLFILNVHGRSSMSEIATHALMKMPTLTRVIQRMKADGLVETATLASDNRVTEGTMTPAGIEMVHRIQEATKTLFVRSLGPLSPKQIATLNGLLENICDSLLDPH
jgi:MarR family transcriptional regulator, organic hydroperoxide resistance regulator